MGNMHNMTIVTWHYCPCLNHSDGFQQPRVQLHSYLSDSVIMEQVLFHCLFAKMLCRNMKGDLSNSLTLREETPQTLWQAGLPAQRRVTAGRAGGSTTVSILVGRAQPLAEHPRKQCIPLHSKEDKRSTKATVQYFWDPRNWAGRKEQRWKAKQ